MSTSSILSNDVPAPRAMSIAFGEFDDGEKVHGHYHAPASPPRAVGVVLCNPLGFEAFCSYRSYRVLAERLAAAGFPVLRFDYHGTGDSSGDDRDAARVRAWCKSIHAAIDELGARSGLKEVSLFGVRMGATLATLAACERGGVAGLVTWAPVLSGKAFVREMRAYRMLNPPEQGDNRGLAEGDEEAAGLLVTKSTVDELARVDLTKIASRPAPRALVIARDPTSNEEKFVKHLESLGVDVTKSDAAGYGTMMLEPWKSVIPTAVFDDVASWLDRSHPERAAAQTSAPRRSSDVASKAPYSRTRVRERSILFGEGDRLFGVLTQPEEPRARSKTALLLLTIAAAHRIGQNRMYVAIAREAASRGFSALRFDISGVGDSLADGAHAARHAYSLEGVNDVRSAIDALAKDFGVERVVLGGLCSGAYLAYHAALLDRRVRGVVLVNPQTFYFRDGDPLDVGRRVESFKSSREYYRLFFQRETWQRLLGGKLHVGPLLRMATGRVRDKIQKTAARWMGAESGPNVARDFRQLSERGVRALLLYSGADQGLDYLDLHLGKGARAMRGRANFELMIVDGPDHTFTPIWAQERISHIFRDELENHFG